MKTLTRTALALAAAVALALGLAGCTKTVTVTAKYRSAVGLYFVCDGPSFDPCVKGDYYRVSKADYDKAVVGKSYPVTLL